MHESKKAEMRDDLISYGKSLGRTLSTVSHNH